MRWGLTSRLLCVQLVVNVVAVAHFYLKHPM